MLEQWYRVNRTTVWFFEHARGVLTGLVATSADTTDLSSFSDANNLSEG